MGDNEPTLWAIYQISLWSRWIIWRESHVVSSRFFQSKGEKQTENSIHLDAYYITFERLMTLDTGYEASILGYLQGMNCLHGSDGVRCKIQAE